MLQYHAKQLGAILIRTPKCHSKLASEDIEYYWAYAKNAYRQMPMKNKKGKNNFRISVRKSFEGITLEMARKFARRARTYIITYDFIKKNNKEGNEKMNVNIIDKVVKKFKSHRSALDFDKNFITSMKATIKSALYHSES